MKNWHKSCEELKHLSQVEREYYYSKKSEFEGIFHTAMVLSGCCIILAAIMQTESLIYPSYLLLLAACASVAVKHITLKKFRETKLKKR